jgi:hypothetical protein
MPPPIVETRLKISNVVGIFVGQAYLHIYTQARRVLVRKKCYEGNCNVLVQTEIFLAKICRWGGGGGGGGEIIFSN